MVVSSPPAKSRAAVTRREFLKTAGFGAAGAAFYAGEIDRHWLETTHHEVILPGLPAEFDGYRIAQLSDIHMEEFTEPFFVREAVHHINSLKPDAVMLTGDFVTHELRSKQFTEGAAWRCAGILSELECKARYAIFGNHDVMLNRNLVGSSLRENNITVLDNTYLPLERGSSRVWLAGIDDPVVGKPDTQSAIPRNIRSQKNEPVILLCHAPDYVNEIIQRPEGQSVGLVLSGHTHGGQVRIPFVPLMHLPPLGRQYVSGWFRFGSLQLYVNRGLGTVNVPVRFNCPPEVSVFTLRA